MNLAVIGLQGLAVHEVGKVSAFHDDFRADGNGSKIIAGRDGPRRLIPAGK